MNTARRLRPLLPVLLSLLWLAAQAAPRCLVVKRGDAESLLEAIAQANQLNADSTAERLFILVPDGYYDLGQRTLTLIEGHNISIVGQSMQGTVIRNAPDVANEGIGKTATLRNHATGLHLQDLTLRNDLAYYESGAAGRAVCLQDRGTRTLCLRVRMLSYQDTYYSDNELAQNYFDDCEIHGTVDFICGAGDVFFQGCRIVVEPRNRDGSGRCVIAAPRTSKTPWGYVFSHCTITSLASEYDYARGWHTTPRCTWLHTTLLQPQLLRPGRFDPQSIRSEQCDFGEYATTDSLGTPVTPAQNTITIQGRDASRTIQTTLTPSQARRFTLRRVFPRWHPQRQLSRLQRQAARLWEQAER